MILRAVRRFLPEVKRSEENLARITWHLRHEPCTSASLRPLLDLITGEFTPHPEHMIHLHAPERVRSGPDLEMVPSVGQGVSNYPSDVVMESAENYVEEDAGADDGHGKDRAGSGGRGGDDDVDDGGDGKGNEGDKPNENDDGEVQESAENDRETLSMDKNLDPRQLYAKVIYDLKGIKGTNTAMWARQPEEVLHFSRQRTLSEIFTLLAGFVERKFKKEEPRRYKELNKAGNQHTILLKPELQHDCLVKQRAFTFDDSGIPRVAAINDLLDDKTVFRTGAGGVFTTYNTGTERQLQPQLTIMLTLKHVVKRDTAADAFIIIRSGAETMNNGGVGSFYRIGSKPGAAGSEELRVPISTIYFRRCTLKTDTSDVKIVQASTWSLRGLRICNPDEGITRDESQMILEKKDTTGPTTHGEFLRELHNGSIQPDTQGRLLYDFGLWNRDIARSHNMQPIERDTEFPESGITVALRYINHLQDSSVKDIKCNAGEEYEVAEGGGDGVLCDKIKKSLTERSQALQAFEGNWDIELRIMPQTPNGRTLYKFKQSSRLANWLHKPSVDNGDASLFAEVHLIPVVPGKPISSARRAIEKIEKRGGPVRD